MTEKRHFLLAKQKLLGRQSSSKTCSDCNLTFQSYIDLTRHEKRNLTCLHCTRKFCNNDHLQKHIRTINYRGGSITTTMNRRYILNQDMKTLVVYLDTKQK